MISLEINKPDSKTIRNLSANLWSSLLETLGQWCQVLRGRVSCRPALPHAGSACESAGRAHGRRHVSSAPRALLLRVPQPRRRPSSFSAPSLGPVARCPLCRPAEICRSGARPRPGAVLPPIWGPARAWQLPRELLFAFSLEGKRGLCKGCWGCARAPGGAARGCGGQISSLHRAVSQALRGAFKIKRELVCLEQIIDSCCGVCRILFKLS